MLKVAVIKCKLVTLNTMLDVYRQMQSDIAFSMTIYQALLIQNLFNDILDQLQKRLQIICEHYYISFIRWPVVLKLNSIN